MQKNSQSEYIVGDSRNLTGVLATRPKANAIITSPPYYRVLDYGHKKQIGIGSQDYAHYLSELKKVFGGCSVNSTPDASMWIVCDNIREGGLLIDLPSDIKRIASEHKWLLREIIIWNKVKTRPLTGAGYLRNNIEYILVFFKSFTDFKFRIYRENSLHGQHADYLWKWPERYSPSGLNPGKIWTLPIMNQGTWNATAATATKIHQCPFPQALVEKIINIATDEGDTVLDPFAGSGTVPIQAALMNRRGIGVELNANFRAFYAEVSELFTAGWKRSAEQRAVVLEDKLREALLINRMRALKCMNLLLASNAAAIRHIKCASICEPLSAHDNLMCEIRKNQNAVDMRIQYSFDISGNFENEKQVELCRDEFNKYRKICGLKAEINISREAKGKNRMRFSSQSWVYDGTRSMKPLGPRASLNGQPISLPVYCNFFVATFGGDGSPLERAVDTARQSYVKKVAESLHLNDSDLANLLGTTISEVHRNLNTKISDLRKATRSRQNAKDLSSTHEFHHEDLS